MSAARGVSARPLLDLSTWYAACLLATAPVLAAEAKDPLSAAKDAMLCYRRDYSAAHLAQHPKQTVTSVLLAYQEHGLITLVLTRKTGAAKQISAGCGWTPSGAGIDTSGRTMIPGFRGSAAYECLVTVGASAEEGGYLLIEPAHDATTLTVFIQSPITTNDIEYRKGKAYNLTLGPEDVAFRLARIDPKPCASFKAKTD